MDSILRVVAGRMTSLTACTTLQLSLLRHFSCMADLNVLPQGGNSRLDLLCNSAASVFDERLF